MSNLPWPEFEAKDQGKARQLTRRLDGEPGEGLAKHGGPDFNSRNGAARTAKTGPAARA